MSDVFLWILVLLNSLGVLAALLLGRMALRRIRLDRTHIAELRTLLDSSGQPPLPVKKKQYVELANQAVKAIGGSQSSLPIRAGSEHGEDLILWDFFGRKLSGYYLDIGAHDGVTLSNTYFFESIGWTGLCVEAHPELAKQATTVRSRSRVVHAACGDRTASGTVAFHLACGPEWASSRSFLETSHETREQLHRQAVTFQTIEVPYTSVTTLLGADGSAIDFVSIDVEGAELKVLQGIDFSRIRPTAFVIEDNTRGADPTVSNYLASVGYRKVLSVAVNDFYLAVNDARSFRV